MRLFGFVLLSALFIAGCAGLGVIGGSSGGGTGVAAEAERFNKAAYQANPREVTEAYTEVSEEDVLTESKKVILPQFKVYFNLQASGAAETGHALSGLGSKRTEARVSQRVDLAVSPKVFQQITDSVYQEFKSKLEAAGYDVIEPKELAEQFPEYKEYQAEDKMKKSPQMVDEDYVAYAPSGWKLEQPGLDIGRNRTSGAISAFSTTLHDVVVRASKKLEAIHIQPTYVVGFAEISSEGNHNRAELKATPSIRIGNQTQFKIGESWTVGAIKLKKPVASSVGYGKLLSADSAGDKVRGVSSALSRALSLGSTSDSASYVIQANTTQYKKEVLAQLSLANEILFNRLKQEKAEN